MNDIKQNDLVTINENRQPTILLRKVLNKLGVEC